MRKIYSKILIALFALSVLMLTSCNKYTDIDPKGKNLLKTAAQLEYLLNYSFNSSSAFGSKYWYAIDNDSYVPMKNLATVLAGEKGWDYVCTTFDSTIDRAALATTDAQYSTLYSIINTRLNVILQQAGVVTDNPSKVKQLSAEAYVLRAYLHFILVNVYAKAYDPATAATDGGVPYMNKINFDELAVKSTVKQVYDNMLSDLDAAFALDALPDQPASSLRIGKGFAYAVKARVLLAMRNYSAALEAANKALEYNSALEDHRTFLTPDNGGTGTGIIARDGIKAADNYFYASSVFYNPSWYMAPPETAQYYETGNIFRYYTDPYSYSEDYKSYYTNTEGALLWYSYDYQQNSGGLTTADAYMVKAECLIRAGQISDGMDILNAIRVNRIRPADYEPISAATVAEGMVYLKKVSRIEFLYTWRNFANIKRWNTEVAYREVITRTITPNGSTEASFTYTLPPGSKLWIFPFPQTATNFNTNLTQNY